MFTFQNDRPVRYLSCVISRMSPVVSTRLPIRASAADFGDLRVAVPDPSAPVPVGPSRSSSVAEPSAAAGTASDETSVTLTVKANPRQVGRGRNLAEQTSAILQFYASIVGEAPYPTFTLAVTENELPGGHSPAYFAVLNQVLPTAPIVWRNDPGELRELSRRSTSRTSSRTSGGDRPSGWKNYHEQWISEGFAQYFAALYAEKALDANVFPSVLRQMRRSGIDMSPQGPIYLGYRLGHIRAERPVFRSLVYNKSAIVLHMLRRLVGDEAFFFGAAALLLEWRFKKAGTDDFRVAMEKADRARPRSVLRGVDLRRRRSRASAFTYRSPDIERGSA